MRTLKKFGFLGLIFFGLMVCLGPDVQAVPETDLATQSSYYYYMKVNDLKTAEQLKDEVQIEAYDELDGCINSSIECKMSNEFQEKVLNVQTVSERELGSYDFTYTAKDKSNNTASLVIHVNVVDNEPPVLDKQRSTLEYHLEFPDERITEAEVYQGLVLTDNYTPSNMFKYEIYGGDYFGKERPSVRDYAETVRVKDSSDNYTDVIVHIIVEDTTPPVVHADKTTITQSYQLKTDINVLLESLNITATDYSLLKNSGKVYEITKDDYTSNSGKVGTYTVSLTIADQYDNEAHLDIKISIIDNIPPVFYLESSKVYVSPQTILQKNDFVALLENNHKLKNMDYRVEVMDDNYTNNAQNEGQYSYQLRVIYEEKEYEDFEFIVHVINDSIIKDQKLSFWSKALNFFKNFGKVIWDILRWPVEKIRNLF